MSGKTQASILADWGNSSGRLFCVRGETAKAELLDKIRISGAKDTENCAAAYEIATQAWRDTYDIQDAWFTGAVTSNIGWLTTDYAPVPAALDDIQITTLDIDTKLKGHFLQGTSMAKNSDGYFDTVRGEDMQAHGWVALTGMQHGLLCLPGTHTKWIEIQAGKIASISTGVTGETFEVLDQHSILTRSADNSFQSHTAFQRGLDVMQRTPRPALTHMLMSVRNLQISQDISTNESRDYLSGLLIGEDCATLLKRHTASEIHIIGDGPSADRYETALTHYGAKVRRHDGEACVIAGLQAIRALYKRN